MFRPSPCFARANRAVVKLSMLLALPRAACATALRQRKGLLACAKAAWRRGVTGSNHISAFGVWQGRSRRVLTRINRTGETRWHRLPSAGRQAGCAKGAS